VKAVQERVDITAVTVLMDSPSPTSPTVSLRSTRAAYPLPLAGARDLKIVVLLSFALSLGACSTSSHNPTAATNGSRVANTGDLPAPIQCVPFVRELSGVNLYGNAYTWWDSALAAGYQRGQVPMENAVLVLKKSNRLANGHVAMVRRVVDPGHVELTHANWGSDEYTRRLVHNSMPARDVSAKHDWTSVEFFNEQAGVWGQPYEAWGFIYPKGCPLPAPAG
jgi:surface antigen